MRFSPEELEELRRADALIDAEFSLTTEEIQQSRRRDRHAQLEGMDNATRKIAENQRAYYEANREKIAENQRAYREANREKINAYMREYMAKRRAAASAV